MTENEFKSKRLFRSNDYKPFVYIIQETKTGMKYIGSRTALGCQETLDYLSERNKKEPKVECPHCNKVGQRLAMMRWHFDNCKHIKEN